MTGATGRVGGETVRLLTTTGTPVRALVRDPARARALEGAGAQLAVGDFEDVATLDAALAGARVLVLVSPGLPHQEIAVIDAARRAGVRHAVYLTSKASVDSPIERRRWHAQVERHLLASSIPATLLRSNAYMQNTLALARVIAGTGGFASSAADGRMGMVDTRDVASVAAAIAHDPDHHAGATYHLTGPAAISYPEIAATLGELLGRPVSYRTINFDEDRAAMIRAGVPEAVATMNAQAFSLNATGDADWVTEDVEQVTGARPRGYRPFAIDHLAAFRS